MQRPISARIVWLVGVSGVLLVAASASAQPRDAYGTVKRPASEVIHDQTLRDGVRQRTSTGTRSSWNGSSTQSAADDPCVRVGPSQQQSICSELTAIAKGTSRKSNQHEIVAEVLLLGGPVTRCFDSSFGFELRLQAWGRACYLSSADLEVLRDPAAAAQKRSSTPSPSSSVRPSPSPHLPAPPPTPRPEEPKLVAPVAKRLPALMSAEARATQASRLRLRQFHEEALAEQELQRAKQIESILAAAPAKIQAWAKNPSLPMTPSAAVDDCKRDPGSLCIHALSMSQTASEVAQAQLGLCFSDSKNCREAEIFARAAKAWAIHRQIVSRRCALEQGEPCAVMAQFHLSSPTWRKAWQWPTDDRRPWEGRRFAALACADQKSIQEPSCEELVRAARFSLGGASGFLAEEEALVRKQCQAGYVAAEACDQALSVPIVAR